ncbi:MAG TPA: tetratricopeptide repeat protein [Bryobacteraceae bacterium]|jgi:tetratricopeptide (TPR) repeat protein
MSPITVKVILLLLPVLAVGVVASDCPPGTLSPQESYEQLQQLDRRAQVEFRRGDLAAAEKDFRQAACLAPESMHSYYDLFGVAVGAMAAGNHVQAREMLKRADQLRPDYALPLAMQVKVNLASGDIKDLKESLLALAERFPGDSRLHADLARDLIHQKQYDLGLAEALRAERSGNTDQTSRINLAVIESQMGAFDDAIRHAVAIEEQTGLPDGVRAAGAAIAGLSYESIERLQEAVQHLSRAIQLDSAQENPYLALARIYEQQHNSAAAIEILKAGQEHLPASANMSIALGTSLISAEHSPEAVQILAKVIQNYPDQLEAYPKLAEAYRNAGEPALATEMLRKLAERKPDYPMLHVVIARSMLDENPVDYPSILRELAQAQSASPNDYDVYYLRGKVYTAIQEYGPAIAALGRATELRPSESSAYYQLGLAYRKSGQLSLARKQFETVEYLKSQSTTQ